MTVSDEKISARTLGRECTISKVFRQGPHCPYHGGPARARGGMTMMEYLPSREDVIAIRCGGRLEREELDTLWTGSSVAGGTAQDHFFVEVVDFGGLDMSGLGDALKRSGTYFRNLDRIGRVGRPELIRWAAQIESAAAPCQLQPSTRASATVRWPGSRARSAAPTGAQGHRDRPPRRLRLRD